MREHLRSAILKILYGSWESKRIINKMPGKYFLLVLMITFSDHIASSHILTSSYMDMSLPTCMKLLTYSVMNDLCPTYGAYADYSSEAINMPPSSKELTIRKWELRENLMKKCCTNPCSLTDLLSIC